MQTKSITRTAILLGDFLLTHFPHEQQIIVVQWKDNITGTTILVILPCAPIDISNNLSRE